MTGELDGALYPLGKEADFEDEVDKEAVEVILEGSW